MPRCKLNRVNEGGGGGEVFEFGLQTVVTSALVGFANDLPCCSQFLLLNIRITYCLIFGPCAITVPNLQQSSSFQSFYLVSSGIPQTRTPCTHQHSSVYHVQKTDIGILGTKYPSFLKPCIRNMRSVGTYFSALMTRSEQNQH
jgi:hypothetical protein